LKNKKTIIIIANDDIQAMCLQVWLFGTVYEVYCVINNLLMASKVLFNFVPDIIILEANMLQKTELYSLDLSVIKPQNIVLLIGGQEQSTFGQTNYKTLIEPFDREELLRTLDEIQF
jgi:two-component SAPR family response regulator